MMIASSRRTLHSNPQSKITKALLPSHHRIAYCLTRHVLHFQLPDEEAVVGQMILLVLGLRASVPDPGRTGQKRGSGILDAAAFTLASVLLETENHERILSLEAMNSDTDKSSFVLH